MYSYLWKSVKLPIVVKIILFIVLFCIVALLLFVFVFPWVANYLPYPIGNYGVGEEGF